MADFRDFDWVHEGELHEFSRSFNRWDLDSRQGIARVHMAEQLLRLIKKQQRLILLDEKIGHRFGRPGHLPTADQHQELFEATQDFFLTFYSSLAAMMSFLNRLPKFVARYGNVPHSSMGRAITWVRSQPIPRVGEIADVLDSARSFRAILDHPGMSQPYDWATAKAGNHGGIEIAIFGDGKPPPGAASGDYCGQGEWHFVAPFFGTVVAAHWNLFTSLMAMAGRLYAPQPPASSFSAQPIWFWMPREKPTLPDGHLDPRLQ